MSRAERNHQTTAASIWCGTIVVAILLLSRRVAADWEPPASFWPAVLVSSFTASLSLAGWACFQRARSSFNPARGEWLAAIMAWCPIGLSGLAVAPANSAFVYGWLIGISLLSASLLALLGRWERVTGFRAVAFVGSGLQTAQSSAARSSEPGQPGAIATPLATVSSDSSLSSLTVFDPVSGETVDGAITQWMTRQTRPAGGEHLEGGVRATFAAGQRSASVHVPFTPPFAAVPLVDCEIVGDESARWKVSVVYSYGMRIELKRNESREPAEIELAYSATCEQIQSGAA